MKVITIAATTLLFSLNALATTIDCKGVANIDNVGLIETAPIRVKVDLSEKTFSFEGPHASVSLPYKKEFKLPLTGTTHGAVSYYTADASQSGHGGETNLF